jgi:DNA polymerase III alpha subunit
MRGEVARSVSGGNMKEGQKALDKYLDIFGKKDFFIELQRNAKNDTNVKQEQALNEKLFELAQKNSLPKKFKICLCPSPSGFINFTISKSKSKISTKV